MKERGFGWTPDLPDPRDHTYRVARPGAVKHLPAKVDLRPKMPPVWDQGTLGSCVGHAVGAAIAFHVNPRPGFKTWKPSRLFLYYNARSLERTTASDAGAQIRNGIKGATKWGCANERFWTYDDTIPGKFASRPLNEAYGDGALRGIASYERLPRGLQAARTCLAEGLPFVFGMVVLGEFTSQSVARGGIVPEPENAKRPLGGPAVLAVGYDEAQGRVLVRNSWGSRWGLGGYFWLPYRYLLDSNLSDDFWVVRAVS